MKTIKFLRIMFIAILIAPISMCVPKTHEDSMSADEYFNRGVSKFEQGDMQGAIEDYTRAIEIDPKYTSAYLNRAHAKFKSDDLMGSIEDLITFIELDPNNETAYNNRGFIRQILGDLEGAVEDYNKAIKINPNFGDAYFNRSTALKFMGNLEGAIKDYNMLIQINPNDVRAYYYRGAAKFDMGDFQGSLEDFSRVIESEENNNIFVKYAVLRIWAIKARAGKKTEAVEEVGKFVKAAPGEEWTDTLLKFYAGLTGEKALLQAIKSGGSHTGNEKKCEAYFFLAQYYLVNGDPKTAIEYFEKCIATGMTGFTEYYSAKYELERLKKK